MAIPIELRFAPAVTSMVAALEPHAPWLESVLGCPLGQVLTLELDVPLGELAADTLLAGVPLDRQCLGDVETLRSLVERFELPPGVSPRMELHPSRDRQAPLSIGTLGWDPHWKETPVAVWFHGLTRAVVAIRIPHVSYAGALQSKWTSWVLVNPTEVVGALAHLRRLLATAPKRVSVLGGHDIPLPTDGYNWDRVVLDPSVTQLVRDDFEHFLAREDWFHRHHLPFRRGYLLYGPPGNGKTTVISIMASHPLVSAHSLNFSNADLGNDALTCLFEDAARSAPAVVIFEDLDRLYGTGETRDNLTTITLQHLLNCLDGLASQDGVIVAATANDPTALAPAVLKRPGRFDRAVAFRAPSLGLRAEHLRRLANAEIAEVALLEVARRTEDFSFAQVREAYILAAQFAFQRGSEQIAPDDLLDAVARVRGEGQALGARSNGRAVGFETTA